MSRLAGKTDRTLMNLGMMNLSPPLFPNSKFALRFELGDPVGNTNSMDYFNDCFDRAFAIYEQLSDNFNVLRINLFYPSTDSEDDIFKDKETDLGIICSTTGLPLPSEERITDFITKDENGSITNLIQIECYWALNDIIFDNRALIMQILLSDFPKLNGNYQFEGSVYFINSRDNIILNIYDDRGMDIISSTEYDLFPLYTEFNHYLIKQDKLKMDRMFKQPSNTNTSSSIFDNSIESLGYPNNFY